MADKNQIGLEAVFEDKDFQNGISEYNRAVSDADSNTQSSAGFMSDAWIGLAAVGKAAFTAIAAGIAAMSAELYLAVDAAIDAEDAMARVEFVVANVAERTGVTTDEVNGLAESLSKVLPIDDEVIAQAIAMGLTFDGVNQDNIQPLISAAADLAAWTGKDLPSAMKDLALSITDPDRAMRLFREANITLTDEQKKTLKTLGDTGDAAGATQFILEQLAQKGIIGLGEAMGQTAKGKIEIMQTAIGNLQEALGEGLLTSLKDVFDRIIEFAGDPSTVSFFADLGDQIGNFAEMVLDKVPDIITIFENVSDWFVENKPIIVGVLAALGASLVAFGISAVTAIAPVIASMLPLIITIGLIGAAATLLYTAWTENWGGIQEQVGALWAVVQPILQGLFDWLQTNLPVAVQFLSDLWVNVLLPAIKAAFEWIATNVFPIIISLIQWLQVNIPAAISTLSGLWFGTLLPAIQAVWSWISTNLIPLFQAIANLMGTVMGVAITALAGLWQNVLQPALQAVGDIIAANILPIMQAIADVINNNVIPAVKPLAEFIGGALVAAFNAINGAIQTVIAGINALTAALAGVELPPALTPGSPTPFEIGLKGINQQLKQMAAATLPSVKHQMEVLGTVRNVPGANGAAGPRVSNSVSNTNNYLFGASFAVNNSNGLLDILRGLS